MKRFAALRTCVPVARHVKKTVITSWMSLLIAILLISTLLVIGCVMFHGYTLQGISRVLFRDAAFSFYRISLLIMAAILAHLVEIIVFQIAYIWLVPNQVYGVILGDTDLDWHDLFYFSAATYTATGYGDLTPTGNMRLLATVEALTGLIMVAWTASFAFLVMQRYWQHHHTAER
jgi:hypothetical protein